MKEFYPNGAVKSEISYKNDQMHGPAVWYYQNGSKQMECTYRDGKLYGVFTRWYFNGNIERTDYFEDNVKSGQSVAYNEAGRKTAEENYVNDTLDGPFFEWHANGQLMVEGRFVKGFYDGEWKYYDDKGLVVGSGIFERGNGQLSGYYWNGKLKREVAYRNNLKHGLERWFSENGELTKELIYDQGKITDIVTGDTAGVEIKY